MTIEECERWQNKAISLEFSFSLQKDLFGLGNP